MIRTQGRQSGGVDQGSNCGAGNVLMLITMIFISDQRWAEARTEYLGKHMKWLRALIVTLLAAQMLAVGTQACAAGVATKAQAWQRYYSPDRHISATLPLKPSVTTSPDGYRLLAGNDRDAYIVSYKRLNSSMEGRSERLFASVLNAFRKKGYTIISRQRVRVDGHPGQDVHIKTKDGFYGWDRMFLVGDGFYQLLYMSERDRQLALAHRFWRSMVLRP